MKRILMWPDCMKIYVHSQKLSCLCFFRYLSPQETFINKNYLSIKKTRNLAETRGLAKNYYRQSWCVYQVVLNMSYQSFKQNFKVVDLFFLFLFYYQYASCFLISVGWVSGTTCCDDYFVIKNNLALIFSVCRIESVLAYLMLCQWELLGNL